jgi:hypothetical protein
MNYLRSIYKWLWWPYPYHKTTTLTCADLASLDYSQVENFPATKVVEWLEELCDGTTEYSPEIQDVIEYIDLCYAKTLTPDLQVRVDLKRGAVRPFKTPNDNNI